MTLAGGGGIFISYRRQESSHLAGRLHDRLAGSFGEDQVFIDVDTIEPGMDYAEEISRAVAACQVLLAVIGPAWLTAADEQGRRRLDDPDDTVRLEIETALSRRVRVIPILADGAAMPARHDLPKSIAGLARRNALPVRHESFRYDAGRLITAIERVLAAPAAAVAASSPGSRGARPGGGASGEMAQKGSGAVRNDANRAARLLAEAERIASSLSDESQEASALSELARALAATDPDRAVRIASSLSDESQEASALSEVARALAATDPDRAVRIASSLIGKGWKASALSGVAQALAATDPDRAARLFADAERIASSLPNGSQKASALSEVAQALAATDPDRAARLFADAERIATSLTDKYRKDRR